MHISLGRLERHGEETFARDHEIGITVSFSPLLALLDLRLCRILLSVLRVVTLQEILHVVHHPTKSIHGRAGNTRIIYDERYTYRTAC